MAERIGWDKFETALLIDACERASNGNPKQEIVKDLSAKLRRRAVLQGQAYTYLGTASYITHTGSKPMNITWHLDRPIPAKFLKKTNKLVVG